MGPSPLFRRYAPQGLPRLDEITPDGWSLVFVASVSLLTLLLFGLGPALSAARRAESGLARTDLRGSSSKRDARVREGLLFAETALAVVLVVGSGLLAHDLIRLSGEDRGFRARDVLTMSFDVGGQVEGEEDRRRFWSELIPRIRNVPRSGRGGGHHTAALRRRVDHGAPPPAGLWGRRVPLPPHDFGLARILRTPGPCHWSKAAPSGPKMGPPAIRWRLSMKRSFRPIGRLGRRSAAPSPPATRCTVTASTTASSEWWRIFGPARAGPCPLRSTCPWTSSRGATVLSWSSPRAGSTWPRRCGP